MTDSRDARPALRESGELIGAPYRPVLPVEVRRLAADALALLASAPDAEQVEWLKEQLRRNTHPTETVNRIGDWLRDVARFLRGEGEG